MKGIISALIVPYDEKGNVNERALRQVVRHNIDVCRVDGLFVNGSTGENFMISTEEKKQILEIVMDEVVDSVTLIAQVGSTNLKEAIELGQFATSLGYPYLSAVTPFYYKFSSHEILTYYHSIVRETDNKMIIYSIPALTGVSMTLTDFSMLFADDNIIGVKFTSRDFYLMERIKSEFPNKLVLSGVDEMLLCAAVLGIDGAIGSSFNVNGKRAKQLLEYVENGEIDQARHVQRITNDLISALIDLGFYQSLKEILKIKGIDAGYCRMPMREFDHSKLSQIRDLVERFSL